MVTAISYRIHYATKRLIAEGLASEGILSRVDTAAEAICADTEHSPTVCPETDGGVTLFWAAAEMMATVIIYPDVYWWSVRNVAGRTYSGGGTELAVAALRDSLREMSDEIDLRCLISARFPTV